VPEPLRIARKAHKTEPVSQGTGSVDDRSDVPSTDVSWDDFISWVEWLVETYRLSMSIPPCWPEHASVVQELASLFFFRRAAERQIDNWGNGLEMWHSSLSVAVERIVRLVAPCTQSHHEPPASFNRDVTKYVRTGILDIKAEQNRLPEALYLDRELSNALRLSNKWGPHQSDS